MKHKPFIMRYSLLVGVLGALGAGMADAAMRVGNKSRNNAATYADINAMAAASAVSPVAQPVVQTATVPSATTAGAGYANLPVRVANANIAEMVSRGDAASPVNMGQLSACAKIYPDGEFAWDVPTAGMHAGDGSTCVAVVEMRGYQMGANGADAVVARVNVAAGDAIKCNISDWPEYSYLSDAEKITFPADAEPTMDDVVRVMNKEQRKNAGLKIAAITVAGALGGNMVGKNEVGKDGLLGTGKDKMVSTVVGGLGGAALGVGASYGGKVAGDIILSTGVNAAAASLVGNLAASGNSVLRIEDCKIPADGAANQDNDGPTHKCVWGTLELGNELGNGETAYLNIDDGSTTMVCKGGSSGCNDEWLVLIKIDGKSFDELAAKNFQDISTNDLFYVETDASGARTMKSGTTAGSARYVQITAQRRGRQIPALVVIDQDKAFGMKRSDWIKWRNGNQGAKVYGRSNRGESYTLNDAGAILDNFSPSYVDAEDGGMIDYSNKARMKATLGGAGAGAALGAFTAYQDAQSDIENRWVSAVREYKDSLQKVYCVTGRRFLTHYNDTVIIPNINE